MQQLVRGFPNDESHLVWLSFISGTLTNVYSIEFVIQDIRSGEPGSQKYPLVGRSSSVTNYDTGRYYANFTPAITWQTGNYKIIWYIKDTVGGAEYSRYEYFELVEETATSDDDPPENVLNKLRMKLRDRKIPTTTITINSLFTDEELNDTLNDALGIFDPTSTWLTIDNKYIVTVVYKALVLCLYSLASEMALVQRIQLRDSTELDLGQVSNHLKDLAKSIEEFIDRSLPISPNTPSDVVMGNMTAMSYRTGQMVPAVFDLPPEQRKLRIALSHDSKPLLSWDRTNDIDVSYLEIYRSTSAGVTDDDTKVATIDFYECEYEYEDTDATVTTGTYYYIIYIYDNRDQKTVSNEVSVVVP